MTLTAMAMVATHSLSWKKIRTKFAHSSPIGVLATFVLVAYLVWLGLFSIYRYILPLEMLSGLVIVVCLQILLCEQQALWAALAVTVPGLMLATKLREWGHAPFGDRYLMIAASSPGFRERKVVV